MVAVEKDNSREGNFTGVDGSRSVCGVYNVAQEGFNPLKTYVRYSSTSFNILHKDIYALEPSQ